MMARILGTREFTGWHMLGVLFLFFGTIIGVNLTLAYFAAHTWTGLVVKDDYGSSQHYNEKLALMKKQAELGWESEMVFGNGRLTFRIKDSAGEAVKANAVSVAVGRPTHEGEDRMLTLVPGVIEDFTALVDLGPGIWNAEVTVTGPNGENYRKLFRLNVRG